jgi:hypothetical protein
VIHIGSKHGKVNEILRQKNLPVLPAPVVNTYTSAFQKKLVQLKEEKKKSNMDSEPFGNIRRELVSENIRAESSPSPEEKISVEPSPSLEEILAKYKQV